MEEDDVEDTELEASDSCRRPAIAVSAPNSDGVDDDTDELVDETYELVELDSDDSDELVGSELTLEGKNPYLSEATSERDTSDDVPSS